MSAATAGTAEIFSMPANARVARYLPGDVAARRARLVVCNGGSPTSQQALAAGVPVLGIASNLDQFLNMNGVEQAGAGALLRADRFDPDAVRSSAARLLNSKTVREEAKRLGRLFGNYHPAERFNAVLLEVLGS